MNLLPRDRFFGLVDGMADVYARSKNMIAWATEEYLTTKELATVGVRQLVISIAYDFQAGTYVEGVIRNPDLNRDWTRQLAKLVDPVAPEGPSFSLLEVGVGEATTLAGVVRHMENPPEHVLGFDISFARLQIAADYLEQRGVEADLFVADLFSIPLATHSIDVVYSSHSLEPNGGREEEAIAELLRVSRNYVVLVEPLFELAPEEAQERMESHGYVRGLAATAERLGAEVLRQELLPIVGNPLNPSGVIILKKPSTEEAATPGGGPRESKYVCPLSGEPLRVESDFLKTLLGTAYPIVSGIPLLEHRYRFTAV